jgi:hypothetical protein
MKVKKKKRNLLFFPLFFLFLAIISFFLHNAIYGLFKFEEGVFFILFFLSVFAFITTGLFWLIKFVISYFGKK